MRGVVVAFLSLSRHREHRVKMSGFATVDAVEKVGYGFPLSSNLLKTNVDEGEAERLAKETYPVAPIEAWGLMEKFLEIKASSGSDVEKALYKDKDVPWLMTRLMTKRPMVFMNANDSWVLRDGTSGAGGWESVGTDAEKAPLVLADYISYDEVALSALGGASAETFVINRGDRYNGGERTEDHCQKAIYLGLVGTRFERQDVMEWRHMIIDDRQKDDPLSRAWAAFYGLEDGFPTLADVHKSVVVKDNDDDDDAPKEENDDDDAGNEANDDKTPPRKFIPIHRNRYLDGDVYQKRITMTARVFLKDANDRAKVRKTTAYAHIVGLGLGVWQLHAAQADLFVAAIIDLLPSLDLAYVDDIDFSWILPTAKRRANPDDGRPATVVTKDGSTVSLHYSKRDPFAKLDDDDDQKLVVAMFAWDANSYPGNEYWLGSLAGSGDPAAAACSAVGELFNPDINGAALDGHRTRWY